MVFKQLCSRLKVIFLGVIGIFRRAMCCFSRRRKHSSSESDNLEAINVVTDYPHSNSTQQQKYSNERDWNSWDDAPRTVEEHIEQYRQKLAKPPTPQNTEPEPDFFQDMTPKIKPQPILYIKSDEDQKTDFSRLEAKVDVPIAISAELEDWNEQNSGGWEELSPEETKHLIREKRKELRTQKQQMKDGSNRFQKSQQNFAERITVNKS